MLRSCVLAITALLIAASCGASAVSPSPTPTSTASASATPTATASAAPTVAHDVVYLARDRLPPVGLRMKGAGDGATADARIFSRLDALWAAGATSDQFNVVRSSKARLAKVTVQGDLATVDFSVANGDWGVAGSAGLRAFVQQLVYTASEEPGIRRVLITENGGQQAIIGGEGLVIDHPATREDVAGYTVKASTEPVRSFEDEAVPTTVPATVTSRYSVDETAPGLARLEVTLARSGPDAHWLPTFGVTVAPDEAPGAKWAMTLSVYDGTDTASDAIVYQSPLRRVTTTPGALRSTTYRLALDDLRPWRVGVAFDPVRIVLDVGGDPSAVNANVAVYAPRFAQKAAGTLKLTGMARAFEATYGYRFTDSLGHPLATDFGTASFGTSAVWGVFDKTIANVPANAANLEVFLTSPKDGATTDLVTVPLTP